MSSVRAGARALIGAALGVAALLVSGCGAHPTLGDADTHALTQLATIAPHSAEIDGAVTDTECWVPSKHLIARTAASSGDAFRVLCRVHYTENEAAPNRVLTRESSESSTRSTATTAPGGVAQRHRDMICIGDLSAQPVADHCYQWAYYTDMPAFEDHPSVPAEQAPTT